MLCFRVGSPCWGHWLWWVGSPWPLTALRRRRRGWPSWLLLLSSQVRCFTTGSIPRSCVRNTYCNMSICALNRSWTRPTYGLCHQYQPKVIFLDHMVYFLLSCSLKEIGSVLIRTERDFVVKNTRRRFQSARKWYHYRFCVNYNNLNLWNCDVMCVRVTL